MCFSTCTQWAIPQFRPRREGPEAVLQDTLEERIPDLFSVGKNVWAAASLPIGAGIPDLVIAEYHPEVLALANVEIQDAQVLAYLRAVRRARLETIADRVGETFKKVESRVSALIDAEAVEVSADSFCISPLWRDILPEIITIEVKVSNWKRAVEQASRNKIFSHYSFVALPDYLAEKVKKEPLIADLGIGLIGVSEAAYATVIKKPKKVQPTVWAYYYRLASMLAKSRAH